MQVWGEESFGTWNILEAPWVDQSIFLGRPPLPPPGYVPSGVRIVGPAAGYLRCCPSRFSGFRYHLLKLTVWLRLPPPWLGWRFFHFLPIRNSRSIENWPETWFAGSWQTVVFESYLYIHFSTINLISLVISILAHT